VNDPPSVAEFAGYLDKTAAPIDKFFNTHGKVYREQNLKEQLSLMRHDEKLTLLSRNGMLIRRPVLVGDSFLLLGFTASAYEDTLLGSRKG